MIIRELDLFSKIIGFKCVVCHQKSHKEILIDGTHTITFCGTEFCKDRIIRDWKLDE